MSLDILSMSVVVYKVVVKVRCVVNGNYCMGCGGG